jgi:hypothetical protein
MPSMLTRWDRSSSSPKQESYNHVCEANQRGDTDTETYQNDSVSRLASLSVVHLRIMAARLDGSISRRYAT